MFKTPGGKFLGQYMSWPLWYADHVYRTVKERHGSKAARTAMQMFVIGLLAQNTDFDYTRTVLFGVMPTALGFGPQSSLNIVKMIRSLGTFDSERIEEAAGRVFTEDLIGLFPGYLASRELLKLAGQRNRARRGVRDGAVMRTRNTGPPPFR